MRIMMTCVVLALAVLLGQNQAQAGEIKAFPNISGSDLGRHVTNIHFLGGINFGPGDSLTIDAWTVHWTGGNTLSVATMNGTPDFTGIGSGTCEKGGRSVECSFGAFLKEQQCRVFIGKGSPPEMLWFNCPSEITLQ